MSALKKMPNEKMMRVLRYSMWIFIAIIVSALACLKRYGGPTAPPLSSVLTTILIVGIVSGVFIEYYHRRYQRCPDCGTRMREVYEDFHARAEDYHILYCKRCDTIWDTTIPKSRG